MYKIMLKILKVFAMCFCFLAIVIVASGSSSDEAYMILLLKQKTVREIKQVTSTESAGETLGHSTATDGTGLSLLLIDELEEGYCKEMLTLFRDSSQGELDSLSAHLALTSFCGMQAAETGFYSGTHLLKSYLPYENGKVVWGTDWNGISGSNMKLDKIDSGVYSKGLPNNGIDGSGGETVFQFDPKMPSNAQTVAKMSGATNSGRAGGDNKYLPDILTAVNYHFCENVKILKIDSKLSSLSAEQISSITSLQHNRGGAGMLNYSFGIPYNAGTSYVTANDNTSDDVLRAISGLPEMLVGFRDGTLAKAGSINPDNFLMSNRARYSAVFIASQTDGWFLTPMAVKFYSNTLGVEIWNDLFKMDTVATPADLEKKLQTSCSSVPAAIKSVTGKSVTPVELQKVYGVSNSYDEISSMSCYSWNNCGAIFHVTDVQSEVYNKRYSDGTVPYLVSCYDTICAGHNVCAIIGGGYVYAYMLHLGGLADVDPTNPSSYNESLSKEDTFVASAAASDWMKAYNIDESALNENRVNVLNTAYNLLQTGARYVCNGCGHSHAFDEGILPTIIECSGFVGKVFANSGFPAQNAATPNILNQSDIYKSIDRADMKPGDILCYDLSGGSNGHVMIYLSGNTNTDTATIYTIESTSSGGGIVCYSSDGTGIQIRQKVLSGIHSIGVGAPAHNNHYYPFRAEGIDSNSVKTKVWTTNGKTPHLQCQWD